MTNMTPGDAARILAVAAIYDRRTVGELDAQAWADALNDLDPRDCAEAVRTHYRGSTAWIMPAHIRVIVDAKRREAAARRHDRRVIGELEAAGAEHDHAQTGDARAAARKAFDDALERKAARRAPIATTSSPSPVGGCGGTTRNGGNR